jgi:GAF domain-containing protein
MAFNSGSPAQPDYELLARQIKALTAGEPHWLPTLSNAAALLWESLDRINWAGFYLVDAGGDLVLGPFQGKIACIRIKPGRGVCGTALQTGSPQLVPDVHAFPGHIACDSASNSEAVVPLHAAGRVIGVLDVDSPQLERFSPADLAGLESYARAIEEAADFKGLPLA